MRASLGMLDARLIDFIASDAHSPYRRTPYLADEHEFVSEACSEEYASLLFRINPEKVLRDRTIDCF